MNKTTYSDSGVNTKIGDKISKIFYEASKKTWKNREGQLGEMNVSYGTFSGVRSIKLTNLKEDTLMGSNFDGIGTKAEVAERANKHNTIAYDLFAMVTDDAVMRGAEPVLIGSILDVNSFEKDKNAIEKIKQLAEGYVNAAKIAKVAVINGEVAELGNRINGFGDFNYNWGADVTWFAKQDRIITGEKIQENDYLIGLQEKGFRSNGFSLVRKILETTYGDDWHKEKYNGKNIAELALTPSQIYSSAVVEMFGGYEQEQKVELHGVSHITGGGIPEKLRRVLRPSGLGARIDNVFKPTDLMLELQRLGNVSDEEAYRTWNMGQGMIIITENPNKVMELSEKHNIKPQVIGKITSTPEIKIQSRGYNSTRNLSF